MSNSSKKFNFSPEEKLAIEIIKLNPGIAFFGYSVSQSPFIWVVKTKLIIPKGYFYSNENGITNNYISLPVKIIT